MSTCPSITSSRLFAALLLAATLAPPVLAQSGVPSLAELELGVRGTTVRLEEAVPAVPKGVAASLRVVASAGGNELTAEGLRRFLGNGGEPADFQVQGELSGPGLSGTLTLPDASSPANVNVLALPLPALVPAGDYRLSNLRVVVAGQAVLDVEPRETTLRVIDQVMVTRVSTRPLTLDEIRERGIVLDSEAYLGFEFAVALRLDSHEVPFTFPVVFQRDGVALPLQLVPPGPPVREGVTPPTLFQPVLLHFTGGGETDLGPTPKLDLGEDEGYATVPGLLVIPGEVGYLKQFFSAKLYVANGAPEGSHLSLEDIRARVKLPPGADGVLGTEDDPLSLPEILRDGQPTPQALELPVQLTDEDGQPTGEERLMPGQQGLAEYVLRGDQEGFHRLDFDLTARLLGVPGPGGEPRDVPVKGKASGGVLVRNPYFHMSFTVPTVVRDQEPFKVFVTVTNMGQSAANLFHVQLNTPSGLVLASGSDNPARRDVDELQPGDSRTFEYRCVSQRTGQVVAKYLALVGSNASGSYGTLNFTLGIDERGVPLSPDTLALPEAVQALPLDVVQAAMRVLGQAWSAAKAPLGSLPAGIKRVPQQVVVIKGLALAEAGLRVQLRGGDPAAASRDALRELLADFVRPERLAPDVPEDASFDQLLRQTEAGRNLLARIGSHLGGGVPAGGALDYEEALSEVLASGQDFVAFAVDLGSPRAADLTLFDGTGQSSRVPADGWQPVFGLPSMAALPLGDANAPLLGLVSRPRGAYLLELLGRQSGQGQVSASYPAGDGTFRRVAVTGLVLQPGSRTWIAIDPASPQRVLVSEDLDGNGVADGPPVEHPAWTFQGQGPRLLSAAVVGPETFPTASEFGLHAALLFDREVEPGSAADVGHYALSGQALSPNGVVGARRQLSGRLVFAVLAAPEGPYRPQSLSVSGVEDLRGHVGPSLTVPLQVRLSSPGGVVTGRVLQAGTAGPVPGGTLYYLNTPDGAESCSQPGGGSGLAAVAFDTEGRYELRYVAQSVTSCPFYVVVRDPVTGAQRHAMGRIPGPGAAVTLDLVMPGVGSVKGVVRNRYSGAPVPGAVVVATSNTDPQSGGRVYADLEGRFEVKGLTVGPITLRAARGIGTGIASTRIMNAGHTAVRDVELDEGALGISGVVSKYESGALQPIAGALVVIYFDGVPLGWRYSDTQGRYSFPGMPAGSFYVRAEWILTQTSGQWQRLSDQRSGQAYAGHDIADHDLVLQVPPTLPRRDVLGHVFKADGVTPVVDAVVSISAAVPAVLTGADGSFTLTGVPVTGTPQQFSVSARTGDGRRTASGTVQLSTNSQLPSDVRLRLSGVGSVVLSVLGPYGSPVPAGIEVGRLGGCLNACGCSMRVTNGGETVTFDGLLAGQTYSFQAVWVTGLGYTDVGTASVTVPGDDQTGFGILRFGGVGSVKVSVKDDDNQPLGGSRVTLRASRFVNDGAGTCGLVERDRPAQTTPLSGETLFDNVLVNGNYNATAVHPEAPDVWNSASGRVPQVGATSLVDLKLHVHPSAGQLSGRVFMPNGDPAGAGVQVTVQGPIPGYTVPTDANGNYHFALPLPAGGYTITASDPDPDHGGARVKERLSLPPGDGRVFDLRLKGRGTVRVHVEDAWGALPRALVKLQETSYPNGLHTRSLEEPDAGLAVFDQVYEGTFSVSVQEPGGRGGRIEGVLPAAGQTVELTLRVTPTGCVRGVFKMPNGDPIPNGVVKLRAGPWMGVLGQATTDSGAAVGQVAFDLVPLGQVRLEADDPYTARSGEASGRLEVEGRLSDPTATCLQLEVRAEGLGTVRGLVTSNDVAQPGIEMEVASGRYRSRTVSNAEGIYEIDGVPVGQVTAKAMPPGGYLAGSATAALLEDGQVLDLPVALRDSVTVEGLLLGSDGVSPGAISQVAAWGPTVPSWNPLKAYSGADGRFQMQHVPVGQTTFDGRALQSVDRGRTVQNLQRDGSAPVPVTLQLRGVGRLRGHLRDGAGNPLPVQSAVVLQTTGDYYAYSERSFNVAEGGEFEYPDLLAGTYAVHLRADLGSGWRRGSATVEIAPVTPQNPGAWSEVTVRLEPTGAVQGRVFRPALPSTPTEPGPPAFGAEVKLTITRPDGNVISLTDYTDANGNFNTPGVVVGRVKGTVRDNVTGGLVALPERELASDGTVDWGDLHMTLDALDVLSISPADGATHVPESTTVRVTFNLPLASPSYIYLSGCSWPAASLEDEGRTAVLRTTCNHTTKVKIDVTGSVTDTFGRRLQTPVQSYFWTIDRTPPHVASLSPANGAVQVAPGAQIRAVYNEALLPTQDFSSLMVCRIDRVGALVAGTTVLEGTDTVVFTPAQPLVTDRRYRCAISGAIDTSGNVQYPDRWADFVTIDTVPPVALPPIPDTGSWSKDALQLVTFRITDSLGLDESGSTLEVDGTPVPVTNQNNGGMWYVRATPWTEGWHRLVGSRVDWGGNRTTQPVDLGIDLTPPTAPTSNLQPDQTVSGTFTVSLAATDTLSGVKTLYFGGWADSQPPFDFTVTPGNFADGWRTFVLKAEDQAGHTSTSNLRLYFDNQPLTATISQPAADAIFRDSVTVTATASEPITAMGFSVAGLPAVTVSQSPYTATLPLADAPEGSVIVTVTAHGGQGETATATRTIRVDRTPPAAPDASRIVAAPPTVGASLVTGYAGAVEASAHIELRNLTTGGGPLQGDATTAGAFTLALPGSVGDQIEIVAIDSVGNRSQPSQVTVSAEPPIPPSAGGLSLSYEGRPVDRVGPGAAALSPDGSPDAVFTFSFSVGQGLTRQIKHIDLVGPLARSTRAVVGSVLGVATGLNEPFLNLSSTGEVAFPVQGSATLTLVAADAGLIQPGLTYTATAEFTDGSRFVASTTITPPEEEPSRPYTADVAVVPSTLGVTAAQPATATVTLTDIRDVDGNLVPDGARVALSAADMASKDPRGVAFRSAGGQIVDGEPAANNAAFRVFTVYGASVTATYSSAPVEPTALTGALALVQVLPADQDGNVLGQKAIATHDVNLRRLTDRARVLVSQPSLYADKADRRVDVRVELLDATGNLETGPRYVLVTAAHSVLTANGQWVSSAGGKILGGTAGPNGYTRFFSTTTGVVDLQYSAEGLSVPVAQVQAAIIQVVDSNASGGMPTNVVRGTGTLTLAGPASAALDPSPQSLPLAYPLRQSVVHVHHARDARARLLPTGARLAATVANNVTVHNGAYVPSQGGTLLDGESSPSAAHYRVFPLSAGETWLAYQSPATTLAPGATAVANVVLAAAGPDNVVLTNTAIALEPIRLLAPTNAAGDAAPPWLLADGAQRTATVTFDPVLDGWGNPLPDGTWVVAAAAHNVAVQGGQYVASAGGQILNGSASPNCSSCRAFAVQDGAVVIQYGSLGLTALPGETKVARVTLRQADANGNPAHNDAVGVVPIQLAGLTSAVIAVDPPSLVADGGDHRVSVTVSELKDALGRPVPDGAMIALTVAHNVMVSGGTYVGSFGGTILGGQSTASGASYRVFTVANGQVVAQYSTQGLYVGTGTRTTRVQVAAVNPANPTSPVVISNTAVATRPITLTAPGSAVIGTAPPDLNADGSDRLAQVTVSSIVDSAGQPVPNGTKVLLTVAHNVATSGGVYVGSAGGEIRGAGTSPGDGGPSSSGAQFRVFTVAGDQVQAVYSALNKKPGVSETQIARISLLAANYNPSTGATSVASNNAVSIGTVQLRGTTSSTATGPVAVSRGGGGTAQVTFSGIKDSGGNTVPDGTKVVATASHNAMTDPTTGQYVGSLGGTITDGTASPSGSYLKVFTVTGGSVAVTYSAAGLTSDGTARVQLGPADSAGARIGNKTLVGGVHEIQVNP